MIKDRLKEIMFDQKEREYRGLQEAMKTYNIKQGILITNNTEGTFTTNHDGIDIIPIWEWLLS